MEFPDLKDFAAVKAISGLVGSLVSLRFVPGTKLEKVTMVLGGTACAWYGSELIAEYLGISVKGVGLIGFLTGMFGMTILHKIFEGFAALDAKSIAGDVWDWVSRKWKA